jgi:hypothetical protein
MSLIHSQAWQKTIKLLKKDRIDLVEQLIQNDSDILRGKIQQIDDILDRYPGELSTKEED